MMPIAISAKFADVWLKPEAGEIATRLAANDVDSARLQLLSQHLDIRVTGTQRIDDVRSRINVDVNLTTFASEVIDLRVELNNKDLALTITSEVVEGVDYVCYM